MYPKTESNTPIHTGGGMIESHFWIEIPVKLNNQIIQIKALVCDSECPYNIVLGCTSLAQLSTWQDYTSRQLYIQQISISLIAKNNIRILPSNITHDIPLSEKALHMFNHWIPNYL